MRVEHDALLTKLLLLAVFAIAFVDYASGRAVAMSILYFIPIVAGGWLLRGHRAAVVAVSAAFAWVVGEVAWRGRLDPWSVRIWNSTAGLVTFAVLSLLINRVRTENEALRASNRQLDLALARESESARTDALTGLGNARALTERIEADLTSSRRLAQALSLLYLDVDDFKTVNDRDGHAAGDEVLRDVARILASLAGPSGLAARVGGDEFAVLLVGLTIEEARRVASEAILQIGGGVRADKVSASAGLIHYSRSSPASAGAMLSRGDAVMYEAKRAGKCRVVVEVV